jgi:hypothetical protein
MIILEFSPHFRILFIDLLFNERMRKAKRWILLLIMSFVFWWMSSAAPRAFPGLQIVDRATRWANESWRYFSAQWYQSRLDRTKLFTDWLAWSGEDTTGAFEKRKRTNEINSAREEFLINNYPQEMIVDSTIREVDGKRLLRWLSYHRAKAKIVLHHTVTRQVNTPEDAKASLQEMYKQHTISQWRWDIGYNFLIDPMGTIYEWRAGWKDVIGAHADRNNARTIGVSLMGNYDVHQPSLKMLWSLKKVLLSLMLQYDIDPMTKQTYFTPINEEPRLVTATHTSLVWHSDTKNTACPWEHVEKRLPALRSQLRDMMAVLRSWNKASLFQFRFLPKKMTVWMEQDSVVAEYKMPDRVIRDCVLFGEWVSLEQCGWNGEKLLARFTRASSTPSGSYALLVDTDAWAVWIDVSVVWKPQLDKLVEKRKQNNPLPAVPSKQTEKVQQKITLQDVQWLMQRAVSVLLYEPTTMLTSREMQCESGCLVILDDQRFTDIRLIRALPDPEDNSRLIVFLDLKKYTTRTIRLWNPRSVITMTNRARWSTNFPLNYFRGDISIQREAYMHLEKKLTAWRTVVNTLPLQSYLNGVAETVEEQHPEKIRAMALLVKWYMLWYLGGNRHPSVPEWVSYQAVDDPRIFQKYVGAWIEQTTPKRQQAIEKTKNQFVMYDWYLPILPFFHCSAWFTRWWNERFWRTDTPWLVWKIDPAPCPAGWFEWHGVWLSGDGAERLAKAWATYRQILRYYYEWITFATLPF